MKHHFKAVVVLFAVSIFKKIYLHFEKNMQVPTLGLRLGLGLGLGLFL